MINRVKFYIGEENGIVREKKDYEQSIFQEQYVQALKCLNTLTQKMQEEKNEENLVEDYAPNIIAFCGDRGEGKTSCMSSLIEILRNKKTDNEQDVYLRSNDVQATFLADKRMECLPMVNPAFFDHYHNVLELLLGQMYGRLQANCDRSENGVTDALVEKFQLAKMCLKHLEKTSHDIYDPLEELDALSAGVQLRETISELFKLYLQFSQGDFLIVSIDDLDLNMNEAYIMAEQVRKYLCNPFCIVLISVKVDQLMDVVENTISRELIKDTKVDVKGMAEKYVAKLLPMGNRVVMPKVYELCILPIDIYASRGDDKPKYNFPTIREGVVKLIFFKTRYLFYNSRGSVSPIVPNNLRELRHLMGMLLTMPDFKDNTMGIGNKRTFKNYLYSTWTKCLDSDNIAIAERIISTEDSTSLNKVVIESLALKLKRVSGKLTQNITAGENYAFNQSIGDVFHVISLLERNISDEDLRLLVFFVKSFYSIKLYDLYDVITDNLLDNMFPIDVSDGTEGEVYKSDRLFNKTNDFQHLIGGAYFTYEAGSVLNRTKEGVTRDLAVIDGDVLKALIIELRNKIAHMQEAELDQDEDFKAKFRIMEFFMLNITRSLPNVSVDMTKDDYRQQFTPDYLKTFNPSMKYFLFDILGAFTTLANVKYAYERFDYIRDLFEFVCKHEWTLFHTMLKKVRVKEKQDEVPSFKEEDLPPYNSNEIKHYIHRLASNATIRNAEVLSAVTEGIMARRDTIKSTSERTQLMREFYASIINSDMKTYRRNDDEKQYIIRFGYLEAFRQLLNEVNVNLFESLFVNAQHSTEGSFSSEVVMSIFNSVLSDIKRTKQGNTLLKAIRTLLPDRYSQIQPAVWESMFPAASKLTKEEIITKLTQINSWTL